MKRVSREGVPEQPLRPYEFINERSKGSEFPLGDAIARRLKHDALDEKLRLDSETIVALMGRHKTLWFEREQLLSEQQIEREEMHFDLGYEYGFRAGAAEVARDSLPYDPLIEPLSNRIRDAIIESGADVRQTMTVFAETIWAFIALTPAETAPPSDADSNSPQADR
jgi:hypothetical protein